MEIKTLSKRIHANAKRKGFWDIKQSFAHLVMLVVTELSEAVEAHRTNHFGGGVNLFEKRLAREEERRELIEAYQISFEETIKDSVGDELADAVIRVFDLAEGYGIDIEKHIELKMRYNKNRPRLHGKEY